MPQGTLPVRPARQAPSADDRIEVMLLVAALCGLAAILGLAIAGMMIDLVLGPPLSDAILLHL